MRAYQHALSKVLDCYFAKQGIDKQNSLDAFLARQQRIKARQSQAQTAQACRTTATALADDIGHHIIVEANHE